VGSDPPTSFFPTHPLSDPLSYLCFRRDGALLHILLRRTIFFFSCIRNRSFSFLPVFLGSPPLAHRALLFNGFFPFWQASRVRWIRSLRLPPSPRFFFFSPFSRELSSLLFSLDRLERRPFMRSESHFSFSGAALLGILAVFFKEKEPCEGWVGTFPSPPSRDKRSFLFARA